MKHIGVVGSRRRNSNTDYKIVTDKFFEVYEPGDVIVSGHCSKGADSFAEMIANCSHIPIILYPANWKEYGRAAGFIRNTDIANKSDVLIACVAHDRKGGTEDTIKKFKGELHLV